MLLKFEITVYSMWRLYMWCLAIGVAGVAAKMSQETIRVLHQLYNSTGGATWDYTSLEQCLIKFELLSYRGIPWDFTKGANGDYLAEPCSSQKEKHFIGLNCTEESVLNKIRVPCLGWSGKIPLELQALTNLTYLDLSYNRLNGTIPGKELQPLTQLQFLNLGVNQLTGTIPEFSNMTQLQQLVLYQKIGRAHV